MLSTWFTPVELAAQAPLHPRKTSSSRLYVTSPFTPKQSSSLSTSNQRSVLKFQKVLSGGTAVEGMAVPVGLASQKKWVSVASSTLNTQQCFHVNSSQID